MLTGTALVGTVRVGEERRAADGGGNVPVPGELLAGVDDERADWLPASISAMAAATAEAVAAAANRNIE